MTVCMIQLRERLGLMKIAEEEEAERKRKEILGTKQVDCAWVCVLMTD